MIKVKLPWPPSVNHYWGQFRGRVYVKHEGKKYRDQVLDECMMQGIPTSRTRSRLAVTIRAHAPDSRKRDLDNLFKATLDSLKFAGVYRDDCQIDKITITREVPVTGGVLVVEIGET